jgi:hypothetical protein
MVEDAAAALRKAMREAERPPITFGALIELSGGRIYGVGAPRPAVRDLTIGPGWSHPREDDTTVIALSLFYLVGMNREKVSVETSWWMPDVATHQVQASEGSLPELTLRVDGMPQPFRVHGFDAPPLDASLLAVAEIGRLQVTIAGPRVVVPAVELASVPPRTLERWLDPTERKRDRKRRRRSRPA